jgi:hypothetical protein
MEGAGEGVGDGLNAGLERGPAVEPLRYNTHSSFAYFFNSVVKFVTTVTD